jgi:EAL domain-containing protein (putative c-di-GMP-specific phosphodiesterase class I)
MEKLKQLPFTELKIDRFFVSGATTDPVARIILESSVRLGHDLGMTVVAEGAETAAEWELVAKAGCDVIQGYVIARPMPAEAFITWTKHWQSGERLLRREA